MMAFHGVPLDCINQAALHYHVPAIMIISVIQTEGGRNGDAIKNKNGTVDLGVMQINSSWLTTLKKYNMSIDLLRYDACLNVEAGTWILAQQMAKTEGWRGVGNYHSYTPKFNNMYVEKVKIRYHHMMHILQGGHFV